MVPSPVPLPVPVDTLKDWWDIAGIIANGFAALSTVGALLVALVVYRRQVEDARRAQASAVVARLRVEDTPTTLLIHNLSKLPVYDLHVVQGTSSLQITVTVSLPPSLSFERTQGRVVSKQGGIPDLEPDEGIRADLPGSLNEYPVVALIFSDASGRRWCRYSNGHLLSIKGDPGDPLPGLMKRPID